jgi:hypothetical protein
MTEHTRILRRFDYHVEDLDCRDCLYFKKKSERINKGTGCGEEACRFEDIRQEAIANGRLKRPRGWFKCPE